MTPGQKDRLSITTDDLVVIKDGKVEKKQRSRFTLFITS